MDNERDSHDQRDGEPGAESEGSEQAEKLPAQPADDDAPAGDTDQHSSSDA